MKGDWLVLANGPCRVPGANLEVCNAITAANVSIFSLITAADLVAKEDALTVVRIVGTIDWQMAVKFTKVAGLVSDVFSFTLFEGIYLATVNGAGGSVTVLDPRLTADLESDQWMWLRTRRFFFVVGPADSGVWNCVGFFEGGQKAGDQVDIRVSRKLKAGNELIYCNAITTEAASSAVQAGVTIASDFGFTPQLRGYIKF